MGQKDRMGRQYTEQRGNVSLRGDTETEMWEGQREMSLRDGQ